MIVTLSHARRLRYCNRGMRIWFKAYGIDFNVFRKIGLDESILLETNDPQAIRLVNKAKEWAEVTTK